MVGQIVQQTISSGSEFDFHTFVIIDQTKFELIFYELKRKVEILNSNTFTQNLCHGECETQGHF